MKTNARRNYSHAETRARGKDKDRKETAKAREQKTGLAGSVAFIAKNFRCSKFEFSDICDSLGIPDNRFTYAE
jgi:hypothetical protein